VTLLIKDARTGRTQVALPTSSPHRSTAIREAGYQAAGWVLGRSQRVPSWGQWDETTAPALCQYMEARDRGHPSIRQLELAIRRAPSSGVLLALLAQQYDLVSERASAQDLWLRTVALHPRYPVARYRAGVSFSLLAANEGAKWTAAKDQWPVLKGHLEGAGRAVGISGWSLTSEELATLWAPTGPTPIAALCRVGDDLLQSNRYALSRHGLLHHAFRRSERRYWLALLFRTRANAVGSGFRLDVLRAVNDSARPAVLYRAARAGGSPGWDPIKEARPLERRAAKDSELSWQLDYNRACSTTARAGLVPDEVRVNLIDQALDLLDGLVRRPHAEQLTRDWVQADPDLDALRPNARFQRFVDRLPSQPLPEPPGLLRPPTAQERSVSTEPNSAAS
jgi:hypothetical protein